jgi:hypothetical protein
MVRSARWNAIRAPNSYIQEEAISELVGQPTRCKDPVVVAIFKIRLSQKEVVAIPEDTSDIEVFRSEIL